MVHSGDVTQTNSANCTSGCALTQSNLLILGAGGGIFNHQGSLAVNSSNISGNSISATFFTTIQDQEHAICGPTCTLVLEFDAGMGAGIFNDGSAAISSSFLANNTGDAGDNTGDIGGGIFNASGATAAVKTSRIGGNSARFGGGVYNLGTFSLQFSAVWRNTASASGGGVYNRGAFTQGQSSISGNAPDNCFGC